MIHRFRLPCAQGLSARVGAALILLWPAAPVVAGSPAIGPSPVLATSFQALCSGSPCTIVLDERGIAGPAGFIPAVGISRWVTNGAGGDPPGLGEVVGASTMNTMKSAAAFLVPVYVSAPLGLLGGLLRGAGSSRDGEDGPRRFLVVGLDRDGRTIEHRFEFVNQKPARQVRIALAMVSGLAMGEARRPVEETLPFEGTAASPSSEWPAYLQDRGLVEWAASNPQLAEALRQRLFPAP
ncbi:MAG: hypothetical protein NTW83_12780 [Cyanobacteria bacterium]|nr:hypothetical protein [Cyanobacteriota bacterium]